MSKKISKQEKSDDKSKISLTGLTITMMGTLFIYFLWSVINGKFLINFSIDAVVGVIAFVLLIRNLKIKYKIIEKYSNNKSFKYLDLFAFAICFLTKVLQRSPFDFSLIILLISHYICKRMFQKEIESL